MTFWQEVALVFTEIGWIPAICLILGMILIIVEIFQPGFGFFGIAGGILVVIGIIVRIYNSGGGNPIIQFFVLLAIVLGVLALAAVIMMIALKKGWLARTGLVNKDTAVSTGHTSNSVFVAKGCKIVVDSVEGGKITVKQIEREE